MRRLGFFAAGFVLLAAIDTAAHVSFKLVANRVTPIAFDLPWLQQLLWQGPLYVALACYLATFVLWLTLLRNAPVGPAFAASHLELVGVLLASRWLFAEQISLTQGFGAALILAGVGCLARGESGPESARSWRR